MHGKTSYWGRGGSRPNFKQKLFFAYFCRLSVRALGRPNRLEPTVPRRPFKILCLTVKQNCVFMYFRRLSVPSLGRMFIILATGHPIRICTRLFVVTFRAHVSVFC